MAEQALKQPNAEEKDDAPDFDVIEEGSEEAKELAKGGAVESEDGDEDEADERLTSRHAGDTTAGEAEGTGGKDKAAKRKRQRQRLKEQLAQKDGLIRSMSQQLRQTNDRIAAIENRTGSNEIAMLDKAIIDTSALLQNAEAAHSQALTTGDPNLVTTAMGQLFDVKQQLKNLQAVRTHVGTARAAPQATDQGVSRNVNAWMGKNSWFRPETGDEDSLIAKVLDNKLADEGYDPRTQEYWDELDRRIAKRLPHRSTGGSRDDDDDEDEDMPNKGAKDAKGGKSHVSGSGQGASAGTRVKVVISRERVQALKDSGMWDDVKVRNKMIRKYQEFDRANSAN